MKRYLAFYIIVISLMVPPLSQAEEFTQKDRERLIRLETKVEEGRKALQRQITDLNATTQRQTDERRTLILWGFGMLFGGMGLLIGFEAEKMRRNKNFTPLFMITSLFME